MDLAEWDNSTFFDWRRLTSYSSDPDISQSLKIYELLILNKLNEDGDVWKLWKRKHLKEIGCHGCNCTECNNNTTCRDSQISNTSSEHHIGGKDPSTSHKVPKCTHRQPDSHHMSSFSAWSNGNLSRSMNGRMSDAIFLARLSSRMSNDRLGSSQHWITLRKIMTQCDEETLSEMANDANDLNNIIGWWYIDMYRYPERKERLKEFLFHWAKYERQNLDSFHISSPFNSMLHHYIQQHQFTELHLDGAFRHTQSLPMEVFLCSSVKLLSLRDNQLERLLPDVGRLSNLEDLFLTANRLELRSLPRTLTFCKRLRRLTLDNNLLDALPGFLLEMESLETVHRHGNHNYFKSTFMWYHTDGSGPERIIHTPGFPHDLVSPEPSSLQFISAQAVIGTGIDFYNSKHVPFQLKQEISSIYRLFEICDYCKRAVLEGNPGYRVITFKSPWLGNSCVPFQHWTCCIKHAVALEEPARKEQALARRQQDIDYRRYVSQCESELETNISDSSVPRVSTFFNSLRRNTAPRASTRRRTRSSLPPATNLNCATCSIM